MPVRQSPITVAVIIATYNRAHYLPDALDSVLAQSRAPDEIIVVDDGSNDDTAEVVARYAPAVRYFYQKNQGRAAASNFALARSHCSHVCLFDDDDILLANALQIHLETLSTYPDADYTYSPNLSYDEAPDTSIWDDAAWRSIKHCQATTPEMLFLKTLEWGDAFLTYLQGMLIPARCIREVGLFKHELLRTHDYELMLALARRYRGVSTTEPTFVMRNHNGFRGPAIERHSTAQRPAIWTRYARVTLLRYYETLPLSEYLPKKNDASSDRGLTPAETFFALLERSRIMFSRGMFEQGLQDIERLGEGYCLTPTQIDEIRLVVRQAADIRKSQYSSAAPGMASRIAAKNYPRKVKHQLLDECFKGLCWASLRFLRHGEPANAALMLYAIGLLAPRRMALIR